MQTPYCYLPDHHISLLLNGLLFPHSLQGTTKTPLAFTIHCHPHLWFPAGPLRPYITSRWTQTCPFQGRCLCLDASTHMPWMFHWPPLAPEDQQPMGRCHQLTCCRTPAPCRTRDSVNVDRNESFFIKEKNLVGTCHWQTTHTYSQNQNDIVPAYFQILSYIEGLLGVIYGQQRNTWDSIKETRWHIVKLNVKYVLTSAHIKYPITYYYSFSLSQSKTAKIVLIMPFNNVIYNQ